MKTKHLLLVLLALGLFGSGTALFAAAGTWQGGTAGDWDTAGNWSGGSAPTAGQLATFNQAGNTTITLDAPAAANIQQYGTGNVEIVGSGANAFTLNSTSSPPAITMGLAGNGAQAAGNLKFSGPLTVGSNGFYITQSFALADLEDTAGIVEFAGPMTNTGGSAKIMYITGFFDGAVRFSDGFSAGVGGLRVQFSTANLVQNEAKYLELNSNTVGLDWVRLTNSGGTYGNVVIRAIGGERTLTGTNTGGTIQISSATSSRVEFGGASNLNIGTAGTNTIAFGNNAFTPTGGAFAFTQTNSGKTDLNGNILLNSGAIAGITSFTIDGAGAGDLELGAIQQNSAANASSVTINRGAGTITRFTGANTYNGTTTVTAGTLIINGTTSAGSGAYNINGGALGGNGTITTNNANVTLADGAALMPGDGSGEIFTMNLGSGVLDLSAMATAARLMFGLGTDSDRIDLTSGTLNIGSLYSSEFSFDQLSGFEAGTYTLFNTSSAITSVFLDTALFAIDGSWNGQLQFADSNQDIQLVVTAVPEPGTVALLLGSLGSLLVFRRSRTSRA